MHVEDTNTLRDNLLCEILGTLFQEFQGASVRKSLFKKNPGTSQKVQRFKVTSPEVQRFKVTSPEVQRFKVTSPEVQTKCPLEIQGAFFLGFCQLL